MSSQPKVITERKTETAKPWSAQEQYYKDMYAKADKALQATNNNPFTGDFLAKPSETQRQGFDLAKEAALNPRAMVAAAPDNSAIRDYAAKSLEGGFLPGADPEFAYKANPFLQQVISGAIDPARRQLTEQVLPSISDRAIAEGAYGGAGQDIAQGQVVDEFGRTAANIGARISSEDFNNQQNLWAQQLARASQERMQGRSLQQNAAGILGEINASDWGAQNALLTDQERMRVQPGQDLIQLGGIEQMWDQNALDNAQQQHAAKQAAAWYGLGEMGNLLGAGGFGTKTGTATAPNPNYVDPFTNMMKIALGGGAAVAGMGGQGGFGLWGRKAA